MCPILRDGETSGMTVLIVDDEPAARTRLREAVERYADERDVPCVVREYASGEHCLREWQGDADAVFLDVEMQGADGFDTARSIRALDLDVPIVFVTNMAQFAIRGYEVGALNYLLKPVSYYALARELDQMISRRGAMPAESVLLPLKEGIARVPLADIVYVESTVRHKIAVRTITGSYEFTGTLKGMGDMLSGKGFDFCNSCYLVNMRYVKAVRQDDCVVGGRGLDSVNLAMSRRRKRSFMQTLCSYASAQAG